MTDTNVVTVIGRLTKNAELKQTPGFAVGFFTIATNRKKKNQDNTYTEEASFFDVNIYGKYAETMTGRLKRGELVCVVGSLKQERWQDNTGKSRTRVLITADSVQIFGGKNAQ